MGPWNVGHFGLLVVVFTDSADRAQGVFDDVRQHLAVPSYVEDGIVFGPFYEGHEGTAIYNSSFRPAVQPTAEHGQRGRHGTWGERCGRFPCGDPIDARLRDAQMAVADSAGLGELTKGVGAKPQHKRAP
jgi:hypothetical protein